jgi:hypothetical protein
MIEGMRLGCHHSAGQTRDPEAATSPLSLLLSPLLSQGPSEWFFFFHTDPAAYFLPPHATPFLPCVLSGGLTNLGTVLLAGTPGAPYGKVLWTDFREIEVNMRER